MTNQKPIEEQLREFLHNAEGLNLFEPCEENCQNCEQCEVARDYKIIKDALLAAQAPEDWLGDRVPKDWTAAQPAPAAAVAAERERCAKILDDVVAEHRKNNPPHEFCEDYGCSSIEDLAAAIRATLPSEPQQEPR